jgi:DNA-binding CsgD family transcriptional regulator
MVVAGLTYREMARRAGVSYETVKTRLVRLRKKTGAGNKTLLAVWALARKGSET